MVERREVAEEAGVGRGGGLDDDGGAPEWGPVAVAGDEGGEARGVVVGCGEGDGAVRGRR